MNGLNFPRFIRCDYYASGLAVVNGGDEWYVIQRPALEAALIDGADPESAIKPLLTDHSTMKAGSRHPFLDRADMALELPIPGGIAFGLGPLLDEGRSVKCFKKAEHHGSAFGQPVAVIDIDGVGCNAELEVVALVVKGRRIGFLYGLDLGINGKTEDDAKCYPGSAGFSNRVFFGTGPIPDARLRLEIKVGDEVKFSATARQADYLKTRNLETLIPLFLQTDHGAPFSGPHAVAVMMGAAINTGSDKADPFLVRPGMSIAGYVDDVLVLKHEVVGHKP